MAARKILAIDDEPDSLKLLEKRLVSAGYEVLTSNSGEEGVKTARAQKPDLIILDILMPGMDGTAVAAALRQDPATKDIPILFLTCLFTKKDERAEGHQMGPNFFVAKPYDAVDLIGEIERSLTPKTR